MLLQFVPVWLLQWERYCYVQVLKETFGIATLKSNDSPTIREHKV
jgi:hypothetical protein